MRTLGETRLWYAVLLPLVGLGVYLRWRYRWFVGYVLGMAALFLVLNLARPENFDRSLMPALQSPWFVPHVVVFMSSYAVLAGAAVVAARGLGGSVLRRRRGADARAAPEARDASDALRLADNLVYVGLSLFTIGMLFGALWAKEAWGHYWSWDPKETWAALTWLVYLVYIHYRRASPAAGNAPLWMLVVGFLLLLVCWFGMDYLPAAAGSMHVYGG
jgi:ABC-type transport system involved in cytochrome c biogenesis permease subunit